LGNGFGKTLSKNFSKTFLGLKEIDIVKNEPLVSILLPSYNYSNYIEQTINSVFDQTYKNWELIIIDDASRDSSVKLIKQIMFKNKKVNKRGQRIVLIENKKNIGLISSYKKALLEVKGQYVAFIDADDCWQKNNLECKISVFENFPNSSIVYSNYTGFLTNYSKQSFLDKVPVLVSKKNNLLFFRPKIYSFSLVITKKDFLDKISFDLPAKYAVLTDWWVYSQLSQKGQLVKVPLNLVAKREHEDGFSKKFFSKIDKESFFVEFRQFLNEKFLKMSKLRFSLFVLFWSVNWRLKKIILYFMKNKEVF
jgi:glycosyltransferase involved in cell wall biosynthesis